MYCPVKDSNHDLFLRWLLWTVLYGVYFPAPNAERFPLTGSAAPCHDICILCEYRKIFVYVYIYVDELYPTSNPSKVSCVMQAREACCFAGGVQMRGPGPPIIHSNCLSGVWIEDLSHSFKWGVDLFSPVTANAGRFALTRRITEGRYYYEIAGED